MNSTEIIEHLKNKTFTLNIRYSEDNNDSLNLLETTICDLNPTLKEHYVAANKEIFEVYLENQKDFEVIWT